MKNYLILSNDYITISSDIDKILKENNLTKSNIIKYDLCNDFLEKVIEDLNTYPFLIDRKVIVCENIYFLSSSKMKSNVEQNEKLLEEYIKNPNPENILILICDKLDERKKLYKLIKEKFVVVNDKTLIDDIVKENLEDYTMDYRTIKHLIEYCSNNNERILTELEKLKSYKFAEKIITIEDIKEIVIKSIDDDIFSLINFIINKKKKECFELYNELLLKGEESNKIIIMVADQFRLIYKSKVLIRDGKTKDEIAKNFQIHPYRVKLAIEQSYNFSFDELLSYLERLSEIDRKNKLGLSIGNVAFESFLLSI